MGCVSSSNDENKYEISNMVKESDFINKKINNVEDFNLNDKLVLARVVDVYDGDAIGCVINIFDKFYKFKIRLAEVDIEDLKNEENSNKEITYMARNVLYTLITNDKRINTYDTYDTYENEKYIRDKLKSKCYLVKLYCCNFDKNGNLLAYVFDKGFIFTNVENNKYSILYNKTSSYNYYLIEQELAVYRNDRRKSHIII